MFVVLTESGVMYQPGTWWQRALVADGQSWLWVGTLLIGLTLVAVLASRYLYCLWWLNRLRLLRGQGLISSSSLRTGQCAYLQLLEGTEEQRLRRWRTMVRRVLPDVIEVDLPIQNGESNDFVAGRRVTLAVNDVDSLYVMDTQILAVGGEDILTLQLRRQPLLHHLQRRQFARVEVLAPATVEIVGGKSIGRYAGVVLDIGGGGVCVQTPVAPVVGSAIRLEAPILSNVLPQPTRLTVVGISEDLVDGHVEYRLHCAFAGMNAEQLERVARFVLQKQREVHMGRRWRAPQDVSSPTTPSA
ncbi:MAG: PilZ domain-containing protein [bacterium]|nr:PilZ domain-containing protein [bacterium]MCS7310303.1 PilZ domain-containing protein [Armatimonadota bacterium]MDW8105477.1 PilZ domain-containing protein [Armatimonadota bacterium]